MESRTKRRLPPEQVRALIGDALGAGVTSTRELTDGFANAAWRIGLDDGRSVVLKVGPPAEFERLSYERELLRTEALVYRLAASAGLPQAELLHSSFDDPLIGGDYLIISALDGVPWNRVRLPEADERAVQYELGRLLVRLHAITGEDGFGYPYRPLSGPTWRDAFFAMTRAVLDDAIRWSIPLPVPRERILGLVRANAAALDEVTRPALVHFDIWPGNVFLTGVGDRPAIQAIIDHERAFWGDPLAEFVSPTFYEGLDPADPIVLGYLDAGGELRLDDAARVRDLLYRAYLYLLLLVENGPRQYPEEEFAPVRERVTAALIRCCELLS